MDIYVFMYLTIYVFMSRTTFMDTSTVKNYLGLYTCHYLRILKKHYNNWLNLYLIDFKIFVHFKITSEYKILKYSLSLYCRSVVDIFSNKYFYN